MPICFTITKWPIGQKYIISMIIVSCYSTQPITEIYKLENSAIDNVFTSGCMITPTYLLPINYLFTTYLQLPLLTCTFFLISAQYMPAIYIFLDNTYSIGGSTPLPSAAFVDNVIISYYLNNASSSICTMYLLAIVIGVCHHPAQQQQARASFPWLHFEHQT